MHRSIEAVRVEPHLIEAFWAKVDTSGECWPWKGYVNTDGHPVVSRERGANTAARYAWIITHGPVPANKQVRHACECRLCVRPSHLRISKGRK